MVASVGSAALIALDTPNGRLKISILFPLKKSASTDPCSCDHSPSPVRKGLTVSIFPYYCISRGAASSPPGLDCLSCRKSSLFEQGTAIVTQRLYADSRADPTPSVPDLLVPVLLFCFWDSRRMAALSGRMMAQPCAQTQRHVILPRGRIGPRV